MEQRNTQSLPFSHGMMGVSRIFWLLIGFGIVTASYFKFSFTEKTSKKTIVPTIGNTMDNTIASTIVAPIVDTIESTIEPTTNTTIEPTSPNRLTQCWTILKSEYFAIAKDTTFKILLGMGVLIIAVNFIFSKGSYGLTQYPVTYNVIETIGNSMTTFLLAIVIFYSGQIVWRERDSKFDQIYDAMAYPTWVSYAGKFGAMMAIVFSVQALKLVCGVVKQASEGFYDFDFPQYFSAFVIDDGYLYATMIVLSMLIHTLINNKYIGFFAFLLVWTTFNMIWGPLHVETNMLQLFSYPSDVYSDMAGAGPSQLGKYWFMAYWLFFSGILAAATIALGA